MIVKGRRHWRTLRECRPGAAHAWSGSLRVGSAGRPGWRPMALR